jgi:hypothetical protein
MEMREGAWGWHEQTPLTLLTLCEANAGAGPRDELAPARGSPYIDVWKREPNRCVAWVSARMGDGVPLRGAGAGGCIAPCKESCKIGGPERGARLASIP